MTLEQLKALAPNVDIINYEGQEALAAVKQNGHALKYVHNQTPEICLAAVKQNGHALQYVHNQTPEICLAAVTEGGYALQYVNASIFRNQEINSIRKQMDELAQQLEQLEK